MEKIHIIPIRKAFEAKLNLPGSKSYTNRALLLAALGKGTSRICGALRSDDTKYMIKALRQLGIKIIVQKNDLIVHGQSGKFSPLIKNKPLSLYLGNAGTATRFLTAAVAFIGPTPIRITGDARMQERPIADLIETLNKLGAKIISEKNNGCPPLTISKTAIGGHCKISGSCSSQYLSALLMSAPLAKSPLTIEVQGQLVSKPYIEMTMDCMNNFGVKVTNRNFRKFQISPNQHYKKTVYHVEADASSATYSAAIAALSGSKIKYENLNYLSQQADIKFFEILKKIGCTLKTSRANNLIITGPKALSALGSLNLKDMPDGAMTIAIICALTKGTSHLTGLRNLRLKETNRLKALETELKKVGCEVKALNDGLIIHGRPDKLHGAQISTYNDHRIAMCFAVLGTVVPNIIIENPDCVQKTYPDFWKDLKKIGIKLKPLSS